MDDHAPTSSDEDEQEVMLCPACLAQNLPTARFCWKCDAPLDGLAVFGPLEQTRAQRFIFHRAATGPSGLLVVLGVWVLFAPMALGSLLLALPFHPTLGGFAAVGLGAAASLLLAVLSGALVWRVTANYVRRRRAPGPPAGDRGSV